MQMAIVGNSYVYHMRKVRSLITTPQRLTWTLLQDLVENIEPGVAQVRFICDGNRVILITPQAHG